MAHSSSSALLSYVSAAVVQLLESSTDEEELVRTAALNSLRGIAEGSQGSYARNTMRASLAYLVNEDTKS